MNPKPASRFLLGTLLAAGPLLAHGQGGGRQAPRPILLALDTDHDGTLSATEIANAASVLAVLAASASTSGQLTSLEFLPRQTDPAAADPEALVKRLMALDRNGDGVLTADEIPERLQPLMVRADTNHDGKLTPDEIRAYAKTQAGPLGRTQTGPQATRMDPILNALDANHDGILSAAEIANAPAALLTLDLNHDGQLTPDETRIRPQTPADRADHMLGEWDTNKDGKISREEAPDGMKPQFDTIDTNHDGFLDKEELTAWFAAHPPQRPRTEEPPH